MRLTYKELVFIFALSFAVIACKKQISSGNPTSDPVAIFNEVWNILDQRYALFSIKNVDWKELHTQYSSQITVGMSERELFNSLNNMVQNLKDGHVALISPFDTAVYSRFYTAYSRNFNYNNIVNNYLQNDYRRIGPVILKITDMVGYIYYGSFAQEITEDELDSLFAELKTVRGLIIDVRNNIGGNTGYAASLVRFLTGEKRLVKYELIKRGGGHVDFFDPQAYYIEPAAIPFIRPVVILTNRACFSACNDFVSYVSDFPNVQLIGDQTGGGGSIPYDYILTNGWKIQYSATITLSSSMQSIENGIIPDINVSINSLDEASGRDPILEKAFNLLR